jgi:hypothetical protein
MALSPESTMLRTTMLKRAVRNEAMSASGMDDGPRSLC